MLKHSKVAKKEQRELAATFGWLCVETLLPYHGLEHFHKQPPSGGCVLKLLGGNDDFCF